LRLSALWWSAVAEWSPRHAFAMISSRRGSTGQSDRAGSDPDRGLFWMLHGDAMKRLVYVDVIPDWSLTDVVSEIREGNIRSGKGNEIIRPLDMDPAGWPI
jgi:hypothetical protein